MTRTDLTVRAAREALAARREQERIAEEAEQLRESFPAFVIGAWQVLEPRTVFAANWHIDAITAYLEAAARGEIDRLVINVPPRHMKTLLVSVMWPAWCWTRAAHLRFLTASYGANLAERDAVRSRDLIRSAWYQERWPGVELKADVNRTSRYENTETGYRIATGVGGEATGEGGDTIIIDDPHKLEEAMSEPARRRVLDWHDGTIATRFNDPKTAVEIVVGQRVHEDDLSGHLVERGYTHLCLPARYERQHPFVWPDDPRRTDGELLWPRHFPERELRRTEETMGSFRAAGQLQQRPSAADGELFKRRWWRFFDPSYLAVDKVAMLPNFQHIVASWDTAFEARTTSDYVVGQVWGIDGPDRYLLYGYRRHANLNATLEAMRAAHAFVEERWPRAAHSIVVEKAANAAEIVAQLQKEISGVSAIPVTTDKITRAIAAAPPLESGHVYVPGHAAPDSTAGYRAPEWTASFIEEMASFPNGRYDDQVDSYSQAMAWARTRPTHPARFYVPQGTIPENRFVLGLATPQEVAARDLGILNRGLGN
jgi:predicted phage terminase large subunit-like protein